MDYDGVKYPAKHVIFGIWPLVSYPACLLVMGNRAYNLQDHIFGIPLGGIAIRLTSGTQVHLNDELWGVSADSRT